MSNGSFYHYFDSKRAVLEALIERIQEDVEQTFLSVVHDPYLTALDKLQRFFATLDQAAMTHKTFVTDLLRVWFSDDNIVVREKVYTAMNARRAPLLTQIIRQGIQEGVFTTLHPDQAAQVILSVARGMGTVIAGVMLTLMQDSANPHIIDEIIMTYAAHADALERALGAPTGALQRHDTEAVKTLIAALRQN